MLIIEIAVGVFLGGLGLWMLVLHREKKKQAKADEEQAFDAAENYVRQRFESITAAYHEDIRRRLVAILEDPNSSVVMEFNAELLANLSSEHFARFKTQVVAEAPNALKDNFSKAAKIGASDRLSHHLDQLISTACESLQNASGILLCDEVKSINDDGLPSLTKGHPRKQFILGNAHRLGQNVVQDYPKALRLIRLSADQGYLDAQIVLGEMYYHGEGVEQNYHEALKWLLPAAEHGNTFAQNDIGLMYTHGYGVEQNYEEAIRWLNSASEQKFASAQSNLGAMYFSGEGVEQSYVLASMWFILAASNGDTDASHNLAVARRSMTPEQIAEADIWALYKDIGALHFLLRLSEGTLSDPLSIYRDPVLLAQYFSENYLTPLTTVYREFTGPILSEAEKTSISDSELIHCTEECILWAAAGVAGTVQFSKSADFYSAFVLAFADHVSALLLWQDGSEMSDEIKRFLGGYIQALGNNQIGEFANVYRQRYSFWTVSESQIVAANLWERAVVLGVETNAASKGFFGAAMTAEESTGAGVPPTGS